MLSAELPPHIVIVRIDWTAIKNATPDEESILFINRRVLAILASIWHTFDWEATFRTGGYDYSDWDYLQRLLAGGELGIGDPVPASTLWDYLTAILNAMQSNACCIEYDVTEGTAHTDAVEVGIGDVPQNVIDAGYATGVTDWAGYRDYLCDGAHALIQDSRYQIDALNDQYQLGIGAIGGVVGIVGILEAIFYAAGFAFASGLLASVAIAYAVFSAMTEIADEVVFDDLLLDIESFYAELVCAITTSSSADQAKIAIDAVVDSSFTAESPGKELYKSLNWLPKLNAIYSARYDEQDLADAVKTHYLGQTCVCNPVLYSHLYDFENAAEDADWTLDTSHTVAVASPQHTAGGNRGLRNYDQARAGHCYHLLNLSSWLTRVGAAGLTPYASSLTRFNCYYQVPNSTSIGIRLTIGYAEGGSDAVYHANPPAGSWRFISVVPSSGNYGKTINYLNVHVSHGSSLRYLYFDDVLFETDCA